MGLPDWLCANAHLGGSSVRMVSLRIALVGDFFGALVSVIVLCVSLGAAFDIWEAAVPPNIMYSVHLSS